MESILRKLRVEVNSNLYLKDPFSSDLGTSIVQSAAQLLLEVGLEQFTFKKLASHIGSTEAAIYRYFENKHKVLLYLNAWYWAWMEYNLVYATANLKDPVERLSVGLKLMVVGPVYPQNDHLDPMILRQLVIHESLKAYLTKSVDQEEESGMFSQVYKFSERISSIITEINPEYEFPKTLVSTVLEASLLQSFNAIHLPNLTDQSMGVEQRFNFFYQLVTKTINNG